MINFEPITSDLLSSLPRWEADVHMHCGNREMTRIDVEFGFPSLSGEEVNRLGDMAVKQKAILARILGQPFMLHPKSRLEMSMVSDARTSVSIKLEAVPDPQGGAFKNTGGERDDLLREVTEALAQLMGKCDFSNGSCSPFAAIGAAIDEYSLERANAVLRKVGRR
jgi:hypothetical protein